MKTSSLVAVIVAVLVIIGAVWYFSTQPSSPASTAVSVTSNTSGASSTPSTTGDGTAPSQNLTLGTGSSASLGQYLVAYNGMTLYTYSPDKPGVSNCTGQCAVNWPPYTVDSRSQLAQIQAGIGGAVAVITRSDSGKLQVTYNGMPLYFYIKDKQAGDTVGQGVGGVWYVVKP